jgi:NTE family protein
VIQVLEEENIPIAAIAGSSMGAYVGSLFAAGCNGMKLEALAREIRDRRTLLKLLDPVFPPSAGLIRGDKVRAHLTRSLGTLTFEELKMPFFAVATDLDSLAPVVFDKGNVAAAVHASAAIPGICAPVKLNGRRYTDGGASEPLPVTLMRHKFAVDSIIAVSVVPTAEDIARCKDDHPRQLKRSPLRWLNLLAYGNVLDTFHRSLMAAQMQVAAKEAARADVVLRPLFCESRWYDFENFDRYIQAGRDAAIAALPKIRALIEPKPTLKGGRHETHRPHPEMGLLAS